MTAPAAAAASVAAPASASVSDSSSSAALRLHLVRHAETLFNVRHQLQGWCDSPLTPRGERQVAALGEHFASVPLVAAYSSDLTRTRRTTEAALAAHPQLTPVWLPSLREWNFGGFEGQPNPALWEPLFASRGYTYGSAGHWDALTADGPDAVIDLIAALDPSGLAESAAPVTARLRTALARILATPGPALGAAPAAALAVVGAPDATLSPARRVTPGPTAGAAPAGGDDAVADVLVVTHGAVLQSLVPLLVPGGRIAPGYPNCGITTVTLRPGATPTLGPLDPSCSLPTDTEPLTLP